MTYRGTKPERTAKWHDARDRLAVVRQAHDDALARGGAAAVAELRSGGMESVDAAFANERALFAASPAGYAFNRRERSKAEKAAAEENVARLQDAARGPATTTAARAAGGRTRRDARVGRPRGRAVTHSASIKFHGASERYLTH